MRPHPGGKSRLLVLDDVKIVLHELQRFFERNNFAVTAVSTIEEAEAELRDSGRFEVLVSDMRLTEGEEEGGLNLASRLNQRVVRPEIIIFTAYPNTDNANRCMQNDVFAYVEKDAGSASRPKLLKACCDARDRWRARYAPQNPEVHHEAIAVIDLVGSTKSSAEGTWAKVGRPRYGTLRESVVRFMPRYGLHCLKSTGDGYLLSFRDEQRPQGAADQALRGVIDLFKDVKEYNGSEAGKTLPILLRTSLHFGEVDVILNDREGLEVAYAFRLEGLGKQARATPDAAWPPDPMPESDYAILSEDFAACLSPDLLAGVESFDGVDIKSFAQRTKVRLLRDLSAR